MHSVKGMAAQEGLGRVVAWRRTWQRCFGFLYYKRCAFGFVCMNSGHRHDYRVCLGNEQEYAALGLSI
jgi:hypothetical protein